MILNAHIENISGISENSALIDREVRAFRQEKCALFEHEHTLCLSLKARAFEHAYISNARFSTAPPCMPTSSLAEVQKKKKKISIMHLTKKSADGGLVLEVHPALVTRRLRRSTGDGISAVVVHQNWNERQLL